VKIFIFPWKILRGGKTPLSLLLFSIKFSNLEKLSLGILPGILKLKKISKYFLPGNIKIRINLKILIFPWKILRGGKNL
jgi:hypothetical protein